jgi:Ca2+-binding RTX toxin-like protein
LKRFTAGSGGDFIFGAAGKDDIRAGAGDDDIRDGSGHDMPRSDAAAVLGAGLHLTADDFLVI